MCRHCSADPSFRGFDLRLSPLGAPVVFAARGSLPLRRLPLGGLPFGLTTSAFRHAPLRSCRSASWFFRLPLRRLPLGGLGFGLTLRGCPRRVGLRAHGFRFSARTASELPSAGWPSGSLLPLFGTPRFGDYSSASWPSGSRLPLFGMHRFGIALGELAFGLTASAFRHAPLRSCRSAGWPSGLPFPLFGTHRFGIALGELTFGLPTSAFRYAPLRGCHSAGWPSGSRLLLFGMRRSAPPYRRSEGRRNTPTRHLFHFKTLIPTC